MAVFDLGAAMKLAGERVDSSDAKVWLSNYDVSESDLGAQDIYIVFKGFGGEVNVMYDRFDRRIDHGAARCDVRVGEDVVRVGDEVGGLLKVFGTPDKSTERAWSWVRGPVKMVAQISAGKVVGMGFWSLRNR